MKRDIKNLKSFLEEQAPCYGFDDARSVLELLFYAYSEANPIDNAVIRCQFKELDDILNRLSFEENNAIFSLTCSLCSTHERQAFLDGVHVGLRLFSELSEL